MNLLQAILRKLCYADQETLARFQRWADTQPASNELEIVKWAAEYRREELRNKFERTKNVLALNKQGVVKQRT